MFSFSLCKCVFVWQYLCCVSQFWIYDCLLSQSILIPQLKISWYNFKLGHPVHDQMKISDDAWIIQFLKCTKRLTLTMNCRQLRIWERIRFRHRGTFKQVSILLFIMSMILTLVMVMVMVTGTRYTSQDKRRVDPKNPKPKLKNPNPLGTQAWTEGWWIQKILKRNPKSKLTRYTSLDRRREEPSSPPKSPPPFSKAESRFEREQRIKVNF